MDYSSVNVCGHAGPGHYRHDMTSSSSPGTRRRRPRVIIIGAGFGGLGAAYELTRDGLAEVTILEKADDVGGVWRDNTYPGAACDVPSNLYSYSFHRRTDWGRRYAEQPDILSYIRETADRYGLRELVRTGIEVTSAEFDDDSATWTVHTASGESFEAEVLVPAVGQLSRPAYPDIPGSETFAGPSFHSAEWRHDVDLTGKRVAVLGTGASAIQFVPRIREVAAHVTVYQRSAPWVVPKPDRAYTDAHRAAFARVPGLMTAMRGTIWETTEVIGLALTSARPLARILGGLARANLRLTVRDPRLREALTPTEPIGCKRMLFSNQWYPALAQPNVDVVTDTVAEVVPEGIVTADGRMRPVDVVVYGTGFKATDFLAPITVRGRGGRDLHEQWREGARAYLGMAVPGFPNMFVIYGPNTNLGSSSIILMIEQQARYIRQVVEELARADRTVAVDVRREVHEAYDDEIMRRLGASVWSGCDSWYKADSGRITTNWPGLVHEYQRRTRTADPADFETIAPRRATEPSGI